MYQTLSFDMHISKVKLFLTGVFILSFIIRFIGQPSYPACLHRDEVQWAYNSYSIAQTARDEWGDFMPLHFKYNGEYHVPLVMYFPAIVFKLFGPSDINFRIPFIILGSFIPLLGYWFSYLFFKNIKLSSIFAILLVINPWGIMNSRASGELSILSLFFGILGFILLFNYLKKTQLKYLLLAFLCFITTYFSYIASRFDIPLLLILFTLVYWRNIPKRKITLSVFICLIIFPYLLVALHPQRFNGTNIISKHLELMEKNVKYDVEIKTLIKTYTQTGKEIVFEFIDNYFDYLNPYYIFRNMGEYDRTNLAQSGSLYTFEFIFVLIGIISFLSTSNKKLKYFFIFWLLITPIVGALTYNYPDRPNSSRTVYFYFVISMFSAYGIWTIMNHSNNKRIKLSVCLLLFLIAFINIGFVWSNFYKYGNQTMAKARGCGTKDLVSKIEESRQKFNQIYVGVLFDDPYIQYLWYTKYPPQKYHQFLNTSDNINKVPVLMQEHPGDWNLNNLVFSHDSCLQRQDINTLYIGNFNDCKERYFQRVKYDKLSNNILILRVDPFPDGKKYRVYKNEGLIKRIDGVTVYNLYSYQPEYENITYSDKDIEAMEFID